MKLELIKIPILEILQTFPCSKDTYFIQFPI